MPTGKSGRIVIEVDPTLKRRVYSALAADGITLKEWFVTRAEWYLRNHNQPLLPLDAEPAGAHNSADESTVPHQLGVAADRNSK